MTKLSDLGPPIVTAKYRARTAVTEQENFHRCPKRGQAVDRRDLRQGGTSSKGISRWDWMARSINEAREPASRNRPAPLVTVGMHRSSQGQAHPAQAE